MHKLVVLVLAAAFTAPPEATRDLAAADRLAAANDAAAARATAIVEKTSVACIDASGAPASAADELVWLPVKFELRVANVLVDRLGLRLEQLAPGFRHLGLTGSQADRLVTTAELVL